ncbi:MAG: hypothetical protein WDM89_13415 [Rhizomicrobium sp.]
MLKELVEHHVEEEERNIWSDVKENFSEEERYAMNVAFEAAKKKVKISGLGNLSQANPLTLQYQGNFTCALFYFGSSVFRFQSSSFSGSSPATPER